MFFKNNAAIFWRQNTGAHVVQGPILVSYFARGSNITGWRYGIALGGVSLWEPDPTLGFPVSDQQSALNSPNVGTGTAAAPNDLYSDFENGVLTQNQFGEVASQTWFTVPETYVTDKIMAAFTDIKKSLPDSVVVGTPQLGVPAGVINGQSTAPSVSPITDYSFDASGTHNRKYVVYVPFHVNVPNPFPGFDGYVKFDLEGKFNPLFVAKTADSTEGEISFATSNCQSFVPVPAVDQALAAVLKFVDYLTFFLHFVPGNTPSNNPCDGVMGAALAPLTVPATAVSHNISTESLKVMPNGDLRLFLDLLPNVTITSPTSASTKPANIGPPTGGFAVVTRGTNVIFEGAASYLDSNTVAPGISAIIKGLKVKPSSLTTCCSLDWSSNVEGHMASGPSVGLVFRTAGLQWVTLTATDSNGLSSNAVVLVLVTDLGPVVSITAPPSGTTVDKGATTELTGQASNPGFFGNVPCDTLVWTSSNPTDTQFPIRGCDVFTVFATEGVRTLTLTNTDLLGISGKAAVDISVVTAPAGSPPVVTITHFPAGGLGADLTLSGTAFDPGGAPITSWAWTVSANGSAPQLIATTPTTTWQFTGGCGQTDVFTLTATDANGLTGSASTPPVNFSCPPR